VPFPHSLSQLDVLIERGWNARPQLFAAIMNYEVKINVTSCFTAGVDFSIKLPLEPSDNSINKAGTHSAAFASVNQMCFGAASASL
jgi:hypothetical protein